MIISRSDTSPIICHLRYVVDPEKIEDFKQYAKAWVTLINRHGGTHDGYYAGVASPTGQISFPDIGRDSPTNIVLASFSFPDLGRYLDYREAVKQDPLCTSAEAIMRESGCVLSYERSFLKSLIEGDLAG